MKKLFCLVLLALFSFSIVYGEVVVSVSGGYTTFAMGKVNDDLNFRFANSGYDATWSQRKTLVSGGYTLGGQLSYLTGSGISFDLRAEYAAPSDGELKYEKNLSTVTDTYMSTFIPVLGGISFNAYIPGTPISIGASAASGYGFANSLNILKWTYNGSTLTDDELRGSGGCFMYQGTGNIGYQFSKSMDVRINIGYRFALVTELKADRTILGSVQGESIKDANGSVMSYDFTGMIFQVSISNKF